MQGRANNESPSGEEKSLPRKTTEVRLEAFHDDDPVSRAHKPQPALIMVEGDLPGQVFRLRPGRQIVGRRLECDIRIRERAVSGIHAAVVRQDNDVTISDLESTNGTIVNGTRIEDPMALAQGSLVKLGNCVFKYVDSLLEVEFTEALHKRSITDQLTGAFNKAYLESRLGFFLDSASDDKPVSVIAFDFDGFKQVNDQYGHAAGDYILSATSSLIAARFVRNGDLFARMGGEEFAILLPDTPLAGSVDAAEQIRRAVEANLFEFESLQIRLTCSFGVCCGISNTQQPADLLAHADELLYRSKREGRNRVSY